MTSPPAPSPTHLPWPHCARNTSTAAPVGCIGIRVAGHARCLAHLDPADRAAYLAGLSPGADVNHCGTTFDGPLLAELLDALRDPSTTRARFGTAWFDGATFSADARFDGVMFGADARFDGATFSADARFDGVMFGSDARFGGTKFHGQVSFDDTRFVGLAMFGHTRFHAHARMVRAVFDSEAFFGGTVFERHANFASAIFRGTTLIGPLECRGGLVLVGTVFEVPATIQASAAFVECVRTRWDSAATLRLRYARVDLTDAVLTHPVTVAAHTAPFLDTYGDPVDESAMTGSPDIRVTSLSGVDAAHLVLTNTDLTECRFFGAVHLDQLRLGGETTFARTPIGFDARRMIPLRWTNRSALAEEHHWRAHAPGRARLRPGWTPAPPQPGPATCPPGPPALAALYRQLRKAFEDGKDEPGAADFYMGEMEMRRLDRRPGRNRAERGLLTAYWALSGYGLRASRALTWLLLAMTTTVLAMMLWGLPTSDPEPHTTGIQAQPGQRVDLITDNPEPTLGGPLHDRLTARRAEKATRVVLNSVVFRSSGQNLTTAGSYIEMTSRFLEPVLLGLAALAIRGRVKR
ncbi:pentapeptide repeat-containing protein [Embleya sp. NPDC001921]